MPKPAANHLRASDFNAIADSYFVYKVTFTLINSRTVSIIASASMRHS